MFRCDNAAIVTLPDERMISTAAGLRVFLCPKCDETHIQINTTAGVVLCVSYPAPVAEEIAKKLINPEPADPSTF